ncbi:MAG: alkene reductase, partial [Stellaceae bacterium]
MDLLDPIQVGRYSLGNRLVMAAMTRNRSPNEIPGDLNVEYYGQRAGAGLIVAESTAISEQGLGWRDSPGIYTPAMIAGWKRVTDAVHAKGGHIFLQLWHCGRCTH